MATKLRNMQDFIQGGRNFPLSKVNFLPFQIRIIAKTFILKPNLSILCTSYRYFTGMYVTQSLDLL